MHVIQLHGESIKVSYQVFVALCQIFIDFQISLTDTLVTQSSNGPPHFKCVATLPCKNINVRKLAFPQGSGVAEHLKCGRIFNDRLNER